MVTVMVISIAPADTFPMNPFQSRSIPIKKKNRQATTARPTLRMFIASSSTIVKIRLCVRGLTSDYAASA